MHQELIIIKYISSLRDRWKLTDESMTSNADGAKLPSTWIFLAPCGDPVGVTRLFSCTFCVNRTPHRPLISRRERSTSLFPLLPLFHGLHSRHNKDPLPSQRWRKGRRRRRQQQQRPQVWHLIWDQGSPDGKVLGNNVRQWWRLSLNHPVGHLHGKDRRWWI